ncbi:MAG: hypothetical protein ACTHJM_15095 [Marmoricola sp.]
MTNMSMRTAGDEIADLRAQIEKLNAMMQAQSPAQGRVKKSWRRPLALVSIAVLTVGMLAGVAGASGTTTNVNFVPLSPAKVVLNNTAIASKKTNSPVVIGGTTTVPSNATTVELTVSAKGASSGTLDFFPAMNIAGGSGQTLTYPGGNAVVTGTIQENVGQSGELSIYNAGLGTAVVTAKIIGYSTQVTAGDINGVGGFGGQVLTNDGVGGAAWKNPAPGSASNFSSSGGLIGQVLTNTGSGAAWEDPGGLGLSAYNPTYQSVPANGSVPVETLSVPPGYFELSAKFTAYVAPYLYCSLNTPNHSVDNVYVQTANSASMYNSTAELQGLIYSGGETVTLACQGWNGFSGAVYNTSIIARQLTNAAGNLVFSKRQTSTKPAPQPNH